MEKLKKFFKKSNTNKLKVLAGALFIIAGIVAAFAELRNNYEFRQTIIFLISISSGYFITAYLNQDSKRSDLILTFKKIFVDTDFKKFILSDLTSWFYFIGNIFFWYFNISNILNYGFDESFFISLLISFGLLVAIRLILELFIVIFKIAENTSNNSSINKS